MDSTVLTSNKEKIMNYAAETLEAIAEMAPGLVEYNRGVLAAIGMGQMATHWKFAAIEAENASEALRKRMDEKHGDDALAKCLDAGREFPEAAALDMANQAEADAWKPIKKMIEEARAALGR